MLIGFAPETFIKSRNNGNDWVTKKIKTAVTKRNELFHKWVSDPSDFERETYKKQRNLVTSVIRNAKREANFNKLGKNPSTTTMYRTLKCQTRSNQSRDLKIDIDELNKFFTSIGPELSRQVPKPHHTIDHPCFDKTMVLNDFSPEEIALIIKK